MRAKEIRIGNTVFKDGKVKIVTIFTLSDIISFPDHFEGIRLNQDILMNAGFKKVPNRIGTIGAFKFRGIRINMSNSGNFYYGQRLIPYFHTLHNLVFALTDQEINYDPNN